MAAYRRSRNWPPPAVLSGCLPIRPPHDQRPDLRRHRVGWLHPRQVGVCAGGRQADLPGMRRAAEVRGWLRAATRRAEPLRATAAVSAYARDPMLGAIPPQHTPLADAVEAMGATRRRARSAVCRVAARLAADLLVHRRAAPGTRPSRCSTWCTGQDRGRRLATTCVRPRHHAHHGADMHTNDPGRHTVGAHPECRLHGHPKWRQQLVVEIEIETGTRYRATGHDR